MLYSDVEANSVLLLVADDDTTSTVSPTRRGGHEKTHGMRDRRRNVYVSLKVWMLWLGFLTSITIVYGACDRPRLRSIVFYSREERGRWRQGPRCLRCSKLRRIGGLGGLMMTPRRSSGCGAYISELTTHRHRGRSQAPWTIVMLVRKPIQSIHTSRETYTFRRRSRMPCVFS